jgi:hypothetical protein
VVPNSQIEMVVRELVEGRERWFVCGRIEKGEGNASAVAIVEKEGPSGLEALTWVQRIKVVGEREPPQDLPFPPRS